MEFNGDFLEKNKTVLMEEIGKELSFLGSVVDEIISNEPNENSLDQIKNLVIAMSYKLGYITCAYNQLFILNNGFPPEQRKIGFHSLIPNKKED